ncbi:MAG: hypothetical protein V9H69_24850 [Anaerolineae bacterium]
MKALRWRGRPNRWRNLSCHSMHWRFSKWRGRAEHSHHIAARLAQVDQRVLHVQQRLAVVAGHRLQQRQQQASSGGAAGGGGLGGAVSSTGQP